MFKNVYKKVEPKIVTYEGIVTGRHCDAQSRMMVEVVFQANGKEQIVRKQEYFLGFKVEIGQKVLVEIHLNPKGNMILLKKK